jgi:hypothetical protein
VIHQKHSPHDAVGVGQLARKLPGVTPWYSSTAIGSLLVGGWGRCPLLSS